MSAELKPCPFCEGKAAFERIGDRSKSTIIACTECGCRLENGEEWDHGRGWNQRYATAPAPDIKPIVEALDKICKIQRATYGSATALHIAMDGVAENANAALDAYRKSTTGDADA